MDKVIQVLLVDDDINTRSLYAEALRGVNFDVTEANDGLEGLEKANSEIPDIIITGIIMPRMDGFQFVEALNRNVATSQIPVMILSHLGREEDARRAKELGIQDFLIKNMTSPNDMVTRINAHFSSNDYYILALDTFDFDAGRFAKDFKLNSDFVCSKNGGGNGRIALKLRKRQDNSQMFDAEITCA